MCEESETLAQIRSSAEKKPFTKDGVLDSVESAKLVLKDVFQRLHLKEVFTPASAADINSFSNNINLISTQLTPTFAWMKLQRLL